MQLWSTSECMRGQAQRGREAGAALRRAGSPWDWGQRWHRAGWGRERFGVQMPRTTRREGREIPGSSRGKTCPSNMWSHSIHRRSGSTTVGMRFGFPSICRTSGSLFSITNNRAVLGPSRTLLFRLLFCTAYWTDLEGKRNCVWQLKHFGVLTMWQNFLMRWMHVMPFPLSLAVLLKSGICKHFSSDHLEVTFGIS